MQPDPIGENPFAIGKKFLLRVRFCEALTPGRKDRNWNYGLFFNNDHSSNVTVIDDEVDEIRDIEVKITIIRG